MEKTCMDRINYFLWNGREQDYNKATVSSLCVNPKILIGERIFFCFYAHVLFWTSLCIEQWGFFTYFTSWGLLMTMMTFTLFLIGHLDEYLEKKKEASNEFP
jgi:hypothetical protein